MPDELPKGFGEMKPSAKVEVFGLAFEARALSSLDSDVGLVGIADAKLRLMQCRKAGINPKRDFKRVCEFAEKQALDQAAAWTARAAAFREVVTLIEANNAVRVAAEPRTLDGLVRCDSEKR